MSVESTRDPNDDCDWKLLCHLSEAHGDAAARAIVLNWLVEQGLGIEHQIQVQVDRAGNMLISSPTNETSQEQSLVVLVAHLDEVALMVSNVAEKRGEDGATVSVVAVGNVPLLDWNGAAVLIQPCTDVEPTAMIPALALKTTKEVKKHDETKHQLQLETGRSASELQRLGVRPGCWVWADRPARLLGSDLMVGKALDDRVGCFALLHVLRRWVTDHRARHKYKLKLLLTVREELGQRGVLTQLASKALESHSGPSEFVIVDVVPASEAQSTQTAGETPRRLGDGPLIMARDRALVKDAQQTSKLQRLALTLGIPVQVVVTTSGSTDDARLVEVDAVGRLQPPMSDVGVAIRHIHTPFTTVSRRDVRLLIDLLSAYLELHVAPELQAVVI